MRNKKLPSLLFFALLSPKYVCATVPAHQGLVGESMTQDQVFISRQMGSEIINLPIYGWGSLWPISGEGQKGESDSGESLDRRIKMAAKDGQEVMLTCATAPSNYRASSKPWNMEERVIDSMEDRYAQSCAEAVKRWPVIKRVQVWNELKGYWLGPPQARWDYESYTRLYNKVYRAVKAINPKVLVGGGYVVIGEGRGHDKKYDGITIDYRSMDALFYWLKHAVNYDAICLDAERSQEEFVRITHYVRRLAPGKPIWWAEAYAPSSSSAEMRAVRNALASDQRKGDIALWWGAKKWSWADE